MRASDLVLRPPATIDCAAMVTTAARLMDEKAVGALVVTDRAVPVGIVTDRDLTVRALARRLSPDARVDGVMTTGLHTLPADADIGEAPPILRAHRVRRLPIVAGDRMVGMLTVDDLLVDLAGSLWDLAQPVTGQVLFGHPEPGLPATRAQVGGHAGEGPRSPTQ